MIAFSNVVNDRGNLTELLVKSSWTPVEGSKK
jgi:hypothetical protein